MKNLLIKNGKVWNGEKFLKADVFAEDGKIAEIAESIIKNADYVYDANGKIVSAGLVDAHVHMQGISSKEFGINADISCIPFGVTSAADASAGVNGSKELLNNILVKNKVFVCANFENNKVKFKYTEKMLEIYGDKVVGIKIYFDKCISDVSDISPLKEVVDFADKKNLIVMVHSSNSPVPMRELLNTLRSGDILTHSYHGGINNASEDNFECIKKAKTRGIKIDAGFAGNVHTDFKVFRDAVSLGAKPDIISTDITNASAYKRGGRYGMTMCMSIAKTLGMDEKEIFTAVTSAPAKALGKENEWGYLKKGRCADIAVFDYTDEGFDLTDKADNRIVSKKGYRCALTVANGQIVYKD